MAISDEEIMARQQAAQRQRRTKVSDEIAALLAEQAKERSLLGTKHQNEQVDLIEKQTAELQAVQLKEAGAKPGK